MPHLLIAGLPAAGKSTYCRWLAEHHGYIHLDVEKYLDDPIVQRLGDARPGVVRDTSQLISSRGPDIVIDWGFPPHCLPVVRQLGEHGISLWWFGGDEHAAYDSFVQRATVRVANFRHQMDAVHAHWDDIAEVFRGHTVDVVMPGPVHVPPDDLYRIMFPVGPA